MTRNKRYQDQQEQRKLHHSRRSSVASHGGGGSSNIVIHKISDENAYVHEGELSSKLQSSRMQQQDYADVSTFSRQALSSGTKNVTAQVGKSNTGVNEGSPDRRDSAGSPSDKRLMVKSPEQKNYIQRLLQN